MTYLDAISRLKADYGTLHPDNEGSASEDSDEANYVGSGSPAWLPVAKR